MLKSISVCQRTTCQNKGSKILLQEVETLYSSQYQDAYPELKIEPGDCMGDCEMGPIVIVNGNIILRQVTSDTVRTLLENPEAVLSDVQHVQEEDRETFERIIQGGLY